MSAFRRISGADEEIEKLRTDIRNVVFADSEYAAEMDRQNAALRKENARLRELLKELIQDHEYMTRTDAEEDNLTRAAARAAIREGGKDD